jgi:plastocyanin
MIPNASAAMIPQNHPLDFLKTRENKDDIPHTIVSLDGTFRSTALDTDDKFSFTFDKAGTFEYFCSLHPHMKAKVVVTP